LTGDAALAAATVLRLLDAAGDVRTLRLSVRRRPRRAGLHRVALELRAPELDVATVLARLADLGAEQVGSCVVVELSGDGVRRPTHGWEAARPEPGTRVLIVEDDPVVRTVLTRTLELAGCTVVAADDGPPAVEAVANDPGLDLILLDMGLPTLDGTEVARRIRLSGNPIPQIAVTANTFADDHADCLAAGMNSSLTKPVLAQRLLAEVALWTAHHDEVPAPVRVR
jgi:CheY-like chemotaxis protein